MAQFVQQGGKLVGTGAVGSAEQGLSVALSSDGNTAIVGGPSDNNSAGAAWVYARTAGAWTQQGAKLLGTGAAGDASQGYSVALSADGNTALVGGPGVGAWVYTRTGGVWTQQGANLVGSGGAGNTGQGYSVALSADGNTAILGGTGDNGGVGAAWAYTRTGGVWTQQGAKLVGTDSVGISWQGNSVALSADGNTAVVGGYHDNGWVGAAWVYKRTGSVWTQQGAKLVGTDRIGSAVQGYSVSVSGDGNTALVGGYGDNNSAGAAWVYARTGDVWSQQGAKLVGIGALEHASQGYSVAMSADGNRAVVGGHSDGPVGAAWVYARSVGIWSQLGGKLVGTGVAGDSVGQGWSVALSADGNTALVGGPGDNSNGGAAWVFVMPVVSTVPSITSGGVVNGASFLPGFAPGTWITILGANLSTTTRSWTGSDFLGSNLPTQLDGVSVNVNGKSAYIYYVSPAQLNVLTPADTTQGSVPVQVTTSLGKSNVANAIAATLSPALFTFSPQGGRYVAAVRADGTYIAPPNLITGLPAVPAKPGDIILLYGTGFGPTTPASPIGQVINSAPLATPVTVTIGGITVVPQYAGIVGPGLYQFNVLVPNVPNGDNSVSIGIGGSFSQPNVFLTVQQ